jgi:hypothetical protein
MGSDGLHRPSEFLRRPGIFRSPKSINNSDAMDDVNRYALAVSQRMPVLLGFRGGRLVFWQAAARSAEQIQELLRIRRSKCV